MKLVIKEINDKNYNEALRLKVKKGSRRFYWNCWGMSKWSKANIFMEACRMRNLDLNLMVN